MSEIQRIPELSGNKLHRAQKSGRRREGYSHTGDRFGKKWGSPSEEKEHGGQDSAEKDSLHPGNAPKCHSGSGVQPPGKSRGSSGRIPRMIGPGTGALIAGDASGE